MKRILFFLGVLAAFALGASPAMAQMLYVHGGAGFPSSSNFSDAYNTGFNLGVGAGLPITPQFEGVVMGRYDRFGLDAPSGIDGGAFSSLSATANLKYNVGTTMARVMPYGYGGVGLFRLATSDIDSGPATIDGDSEVNFGLQFGAGLSYKVSPRTNLLIEPNYVLVFNEGENTTFFPVRIGAGFLF